MPTKGKRVDDGAEWADGDGEKGPNNAGERDEKGRSPMRLFFRLKDLRSIDSKGGTFLIRYRYWAYFNDAEVTKQIEADTDETFTDLVKRSYKPKVKTMSKEAQGLLPTLTVSNRVGEMAITGEAELVVKDPSTYGFSWCKTEQLTGTVMHQYHLHAFPFDVHELQVETAIKKAADIKRWFLEISDNGFSDADEAIPYYATEDNRAHLPGDWRKHGREQMLSPLEFESGMLYEAGGWDIMCPGGSVASWDNSKGRAKKPIVSFKVVAVRQYYYHLYKVMLANSLIITTVFSNVVIPPVEQFSSRLGHDSTLLLTTIAFNLAVNDTLPLLTYLTVLDKHMRISFFFILLMIMVHTVEAGFEMSKGIDSTLHVGAFLAWVVYHASLGYAVTKKQKDNRERYSDPTTGKAIQSAGVLSPLF